MRNISTLQITECVAQLIDRTLKHVEPQATALIGEKCDIETNELAKWSLRQILDNAKVAAETDSYACQDTGLAVFFAEVGQEVHFTDGLFNDAINQGVRLGYEWARKSVADPLTRLNTRDNTPAIIHTTLVAGDKVRLTYLAKGAGSENMSRHYMLTPSKGKQGIIDSVVDCVSRAGANPCPPIIVGVGIGGDFEQSAILSKHALTRTTGTPNDNEEVADLEERILNELNALGIGAQGFGGMTTALAVAVETAPTHIGMLPVAVNIQCHSVRHGVIEI